MTSNIATAPVLKLNTAFDRARFLTGQARRQALQVLTSDQLDQLWQRAYSRSLENAIRDEHQRRAGLKG